MLLLKSHALGNDYLLQTDAPPPPTPGQVVLLCDRSTGVGGDGLLVPVPSARADHGVRIFNPDGSEAEISGNGLRIFARWLRDHRGAGDAFTVEVGGRVVRCRVDDDAVSVDMGRASFRPADVPVDHPGPEAVAFPLVADGTALTVTAVGVGNPHCVVFVDDDLDALPWRVLGATLERHPRFPNRTNVQFAAVRDRGRVEVRIWERGAGETRASGSSSCAVAAAGVRTGRLDRQVAVVSPGGVLEVVVAEDWTLHLRGPVEEVAWIRLAPALEARLRGA